MAHRIANNGMRNFTHHQPLSVLQAFGHRRRGATVALGQRPVTKPPHPPGALSSQAFS